MDDEVQVGWSIDAEVRAAMRQDRARTALERGEFDAAIVELEELLDEQPEHGEALLLLGDAHLELGDFEGAVLAYGHYLDLEHDPPARALSGLAIARLNTCDLSGAISAAREAVRLAPDLAEAHYYLGLALERSERKAEGVTEMAAAHQLDPAAYPFPLQIATEEWQGLVQEALVLLPRSLQLFWMDIPILLLDHPDLAELRAHEPPITPTVTGLYEGIPPQQDDPWKVRPEALRLFVGNLVRSPSRELLVEAIARTLDHEARDWLGIPPDEAL